jgi:Rod binding domain-containing protein
MRRMVPEEGLLGGGSGEKLFRDLLDAEYARKVAQAEGSLAELLYRQLKPLTKT